MRTGAQCVRGAPGLRVPGPSTELALGQARSPHGPLFPHTWKGSVSQLESTLLVRNYVHASVSPHIRGEAGAYQGVGLRSPQDRRLPGCFWASERGGELTEAPGAAEVGTQGMGGGTGLERKGERGGQQCWAPASRPATVTDGMPRDTMGTRGLGPCPPGALSPEEEPKR